MSRPANLIRNVSANLMHTPRSSLAITPPNSHAILVLDTRHRSWLENIVSNTDLGLNSATAENTVVTVTGFSSSTVRGDGISATDGGGPLSSEGPAASHGGHVGCLEGLPQGGSQLTRLDACHHPAKVSTPGHPALS